MEARLGCVPSQEKGVIRSGCSEEYQISVAQIPVRVLTTNKKEEDKAGEDEEQSELYEYQ